MLAGLYFVETVVVGVLDYAHLLLQLGSTSSQHKRQCLLRVSSLLQLHRVPLADRIASLLLLEIFGESVYVLCSLFEEYLLVSTLSLLHFPVL